MLLPRLSMHSTTTDNQVEAAVQVASLSTSDLSISRCVELETHWRRPRG